MESESPTQSDELVAYLWRRRHDTIYHVQVSVLYHLKRERFFDILDKTCSVVTAAAATAAVGVILKKSDTLDVTAAAVTAALSLVPLVLNPADRARKHGQAAAEFRRLQAECERTGERWSEVQCDQFAGRVVELEATEPAPLCALVIDCQNQLNVASGKASHNVRLTWYERWLKQWWDFDAGRIRARHEHSVAHQ